MAKKTKLKGLGRIQTDTVNSWEYDGAVDGYRECYHGIKVCTVEDILKWIQSMEVGGTMQIAQTDDLKSQKRGEMLMLRKLRYALTGEQP